MDQKLTQKESKLKNSEVLCCIDAFLITIAVMFVLYFINDFAPFGDKSLAINDANIQYLDLFAYLKDVLSGGNNISYTFSKGLGGTGIAVFSYYLSSPFNILLIFFEKSELTSFMDIVIALKLGTAAFTMSYFLQERFQNKLRSCFVILLAISYGLMQYNIAQSSNIMWLDGVYMLPLMLLGVYRAIHDKKPGLLFLSTGLSVIFNWYSAGINCLYTAIWFCLEWLLTIPEHQHFMTKEFWICTLKSVGTYIVALAGGVMLSACLFLPTLISLSLGGRGSIDWSIFTNTFSGNIISVIQNFTLGSTSTDGSVSLFCGSLALLGCICFFISSKSVQKKIKVGTILLASIMIFYWQPFFVIFSLLQSAESYWYRYSYVTIFLIIFIAGDYYSTIEQEKGAAQSVLKVSCVFSAALLILSWLKPVWSIKAVYYTCVFIIGIGIFIALYVGNLSNTRNMARITVLLLIGAVIAELSCNTYLLLGKHSKENVLTYSNYSTEQQTQINQIKENDAGVYRISQTSTYNIYEDNLIANYDEAYAYDYWSISTYTSDPDNIQREFLDALGYRLNGDNMSIVNTSVLAADSLLGVKYILSPYDINGLEPVDGIGSYNGKNVYYNPYVLPLAFTYEGLNINEESAAEEKNPFEYQNYLYSQLLGEEVELYSSVTYEVEDDEDDHSRTYTVSYPEGNYALYGNIVWDSYMEATLEVNQSYETGYSKWKSPSVFYIPTSENGNIATVTLIYEDESITDEQFYTLDLDTLNQISQLLSAKEADEISVQNGSARFKVVAGQDENLLVSIPSHIGWSILLNGEEIEPEEFADCLISIPLENGENIIEMQFHVPGLNIGIFVTGLSIVAAVIIILLKRRVRHVRG